MSTFNLLVLAGLAVIFRILVGVRHQQQRNHDKLKSGKRGA